ncbi:MAG: 1-acyl-sn-glycerol-3-phosphate acyltransferase [Pseudomonadota bacterium]
MTALRSIIFNVLFYLVNAVQMIFWTPVFFVAPRSFCWRIVHWWAKSLTWLMRVVVGTQFKVSGLENIPAGGAIIAPKHQSAWDTFVLLPYVRDPVYILKRELMWVPLFGWYVARMRMIPIDRGAREKAIAKVNEGARIEMAKGRHLIIYPEGTRRPPGAEPKYKSGIAYLYAETAMPVVPVAHNAGLFWPKSSFMRYPGIFELKFLPPIEPGLDRDEFMDTLRDRLETASDELLLEVARSENPPPLSAATRTRVAELQAQETDTQAAMA